MKAQMDLLMNIFCALVICVMTETLGVYMFVLYTFYDWINSTSAETTIPSCFTEPANLLF